MTSIDEDKLRSLTFTVWNFKQGEMVSLMIHLGDRLGIYKSMAGLGAVTAGQLAEVTGYKERWLLEWLRGQAAARLLDYHHPDQFELSPECAILLAEEDTGTSFCRRCIYRWYASGDYR